MQKQLPTLNKEQRQQLRLQIEAEIYSRSLYEFFVAATKVLYPQVDWQYNWHFEYICNLLQNETERIIRKEKKDRDIIINMPFRSGKSILISQIYPVWCWIKDPSMSVMQVSHSETLATKHSHWSRMLVESDWFKQLFPTITLRLDANAKSNYLTNSGGKRISFGINSSIIGEGATIIIGDDLNNPSDGQLVTAKINETFTDTVYSRLNNPEIDIRIIIQQRVAENDICGYLLNKNPDKYNHICLPAIASPQISPPELISYYKKDGLFWPERFSLNVLKDFQSTLGSRAYSGQLLQLPQSEQGSIIKRAWVKSISLDDFNKSLGKVLPIWEMYVDTAYTAKQSNDATAVIVACKHNNNVYILKAWNLWLEFPELVRQLQAIKQQFNVRIIRIESKASGLSIIQQLRSNGMDVAELHPKDKDKVSRANAISASIEGGHLYLIEDGWNEMVLQQLAGFPYSGNDDLVDVVVYSMDQLLNKNAFNYAMI